MGGKGLCSSSFATTIQIHQLSTTGPEQNNLGSLAIVYQSNWYVLIVIQAPMGGEQLLSI